MLGGIIRGAEAGFDQGKAASHPVAVAPVY